MNLGSTESEWGAIAQWLHWSMALLIGGLMVLGWTAREWPVSPFKVSLFFWHKSVGLLVLALAMARVFLHLLDRRPALPATSSWERCLARFSHMMLYALMLAMPLSGWVINSAAKFPFLVFGLFPLPALVTADEALAETAKNVHLALFWLFFTFLIVHIGAALRHHYQLRDDVLQRMLPASMRSFRATIETGDKE